MHACIHTYIHADIHVHIHTCAHASPSWREFRRAWGSGGELWEGAGNCSKLRSERQAWAGGDVHLARAETGH
eukprot:13106745-Alexandrium_andersonii.AAC.1